MSTQTQQARRVRLLLLLTATAALTAGCGGGGGAQPIAPPPPPPDTGITLQQRTDAASRTAQSTSNSCASVIGSFYWETGDASARLASGSVNRGAPTYDASTQMNIASGSKWIYGALVAELRKGALTDTDVQFLTFKSGYTNMGNPAQCSRLGTVASCLTELSSNPPALNGTLSAGDVGKFFYDSGHMQVHASNNGLGQMDNAALAAEMKTQLGIDVAYTQPQLAGGVYLRPSDYAVFLRRILSGSLAMRSVLGTHKVCTNPATCPTSAVYSPITSESWNYSIGHWVEDDPVLGDHAFSSLGALGFYPWIDAGVTYYGILAREVTGDAIASSVCGRAIRTAWLTGVPQ